MKININKENLVALLGACGIILLAYGDVKIHNIINKQKTYQNDLLTIEETIKNNNDWKVISVSKVIIGDYLYTYTILEKEAKVIMENDGSLVYETSEEPLYINANGKKVYRKTLVDKIKYINSENIDNDISYQLQF